MITPASYNLLLCLNLFYIVSLFLYDVFRWPPPSWMHRCTQVEKLCITSGSVSSEMLKFHLIWLVWVHLSLQGVYCTLYFSNNPTEKKSGAVWSGEQGGHGTSPKWEITWCGNKWRSTAMPITAMWTIAPFCWNHKLWFSGSFRARNSLIISV